MPGSSPLLLAVQVACALLGLRALARGAYPRLSAETPGVEASAIADLWAPLAITIPMIAVAARVGWSVDGRGWVPLGAPTVVGGAALAASLVAVPGRAMPGRAVPRAVPVEVPRRLLMATGGAGLILLLLAAAHELTIWAGQSAFALAAILLWMNTPGSGSRSGAAAGAGIRRPFAPGVGTAMACALGQGAAAVFVPPAWALASGGLIAVYAGLAAVLAVRVAGPAWAPRIGGWAASLGTLFGIGVLSLAHLAPQSVGIGLGWLDRVTPQVAHGFGFYAPEAMLLIVISPATLVLPRLDPPARRLSGAVLAVIVSVLAAWRVLEL